MISKKENGAQASINRLTEHHFYTYKIKKVITDRKIDVISMAISGLRAFVRRSRRLTFRPSPTMADVRIKVVAVEMPSRTGAGTGTHVPTA